MSAGNHIRNLFINWGATLANLLVAFFLAPFVVGTLGTAAYGVWSLLNVVAGYMGVLDLGIGASTGRHICLYLGKKDYDAVDGTIRTSLGFYGAVGGVVVLLGVVLGVLFPKVFPSVPPDLVRLARWLMPLMALNILMTAYGAVFRSVLTAHSRFDIARGIDVFVLALRTVGTVWVLSAGGGLIGLAFAVVLSNLLAMVLTFGAAKYIYRPLSMWPLQMCRVRLKEMMNFGLAAFLSTATVQIVGQTDLLLAEWTVDINAVTIYSVGAAVVWYATPFVTMINATLFPSMQRAVGAGAMGEAVWLMFRQARLTLLLAVPMNVGFAIFAEPFLRLWMGDRIGEDGIKTAALVMAILAVNRLQISMTSSYPNLLASMGRIWKITYVNVTESLLNIGLSLLLAWGLGMGLIGIALGSLFSRGLTMTLAAPLLLQAEAGVRLGTQMRQIFLPGFFSILVFAAASGVIQRSMMPHSWPTFALSVFIALIVYCAIAWVLLVPKDFRKQFSEKVLSLYHGRSA